MDKEIRRIKSNITFYSIMETLLVVMPLIGTTIDFVIYENLWVFGVLMLTTMFAYAYANDKVAAQKELHTLLKEVK